MNWKLSSSYTECHWEFGFGFYKGGWFNHSRTNIKTYKPSEFSIMIGPGSFTITFGVEVEVFEIT